MILAALGKWSRMPLANPRPMSHVTGRTRSGSPSCAMKSSAKRFAVVGSLPGVTLVTLRSVRSATTVMHRWPLRLVSSMPIVSTPVWSSYRRASCT